MSNMYDEEGLLKPEYALFEAPKKSMITNNNNQEINPRTNFAKAITFKSVDGKDLETYEAAMAYNAIYYEKLKIQPEE